MPSLLSGNGVKMNEKQMFELSTLKDSLNYRAEELRDEADKLTARAEECERSRRSVEKLIDKLKELA